MSAVNTTYGRLTYATWFTGCVSVEGKEILGKLAAQNASSELNW
jgi:hypothetical protein